MRSDARLLIIGPERLREEVSRALPRCAGVGTGNPLSGVWQAGHQPFDAVVVSLSAGHNVLKAIHSLRQVTPQTRIVITCSPAEEPGARRALQEGADEYVIEPVTREDLEHALRMPPLPQPAESVPVVQPSWHEKAQLVEVLKNLGEGPQAALDRLVEMLQQTFEASYVAIQIDRLVAAVGESETAVLREPILRGDATVGTLVLGRRERGSYAATTAARLVDYAFLIEAIVAVAKDRAHWQELAWTDDLSRLRNRRYFERRLDEVIEECGQRRTHLTVLLFDIDDFKSYNDRFGHETGDALIQEVACLLIRCSRESDVVARYGGDEFAVVFWDAEKPRVPGSKHPSEPMELAERFRQAIGTHTFKCLGPKAPGPVTISGGLACFPWDGHTRERLLKSADEALLTAKHTGKNRIELATGTPSVDEAK